MDAEHPLEDRRWPWATLGLLTVLALGLAYTFLDGLSELWHRWNTRPEYSHGFLIPLISLYLLWQRWPMLGERRGGGSWSGFWIVLAGLVLAFLGQLSALFILVHYALLVTLLGLAVAWAGWSGLRALWVPLVFLVFMVPLPYFIYNNLSAELQLISSRIGVAVIRLFGISVFLEGNVIDLGVYKLQVVEACSGLRYLFPLMSFGFLCAYLFQAPPWQRAVVFLSSVPITVLMNSFRIGVIGILVEYVGIQAAEGFLHDFEGWVVFSACVALLFAEIWLLNRFFGHGQSFREAFGLDFPQGLRVPGGVPGPSWPLVAASLVLMLAVAGSMALGTRQDDLPDRMAFQRFPDRLGDWRGQRGVLEPIYLDELRLSDYLLEDYVSPEGDWVNAYIAYYRSQRTGESAHSPRSCLPGGGWVMEVFEPRTLKGVRVHGRPLVVNRAEIRKGQARQVVYYWFQQRGRLLTNEYLVKWYLFWDALTRRRSDGALVRLTTPLAAHEEWADGDVRLSRFASELVGELPAYVPD